MATKFETKWAITQRVQQISKRSKRFLRLVVSFRGRAIEWCQTNSTTTGPCCHGNKITDKTVISRLL